MNYTISNGIVTVTAVANDGWGYTTGRVNLEANKTYIFNCNTNGAWGNEVEVFLMKDDVQTSTVYYRMGSSNSYSFTPTVTGTYWLRLDVNQNGQTHTFSNISIYEKVKEETKAYNEEIGILPTATREEGCQLDGWYTDPISGQEISSTTKMQACDVTYYTHWLGRHITWINTENKMYGLEDTNGTVSAEKMNYTISNGIVTVTAVANDGWGYTTGRVDLEANKTYIFNCNTNGAWGNEVEVFLMKDGQTSTAYYPMDFKYESEFTPTVTGTYWLRLDVNQNGQTYTFSDITITEKVLSEVKIPGNTIGTLPTLSSREGYSYGWYTAKTGGTQINIASIMPNNDVTYYAQWTPN